MADFLSRFRHSARSKGEIWADRIGNALGTFGFGAIILGWASDKLNSLPWYEVFLVAAVVGGALKGLQELLAWVFRSPATLGPDWGQISTNDVAMLVRSSKAGAISVTRLPEHQVDFEVEEGGPSLALSPDGTVAATLRDSTLRVSLVDPVVGEATSWGPSMRVKVGASSVAAVARKGDDGLWCAISGQRSYLAAVAPGTDPDWTELQVDGQPLGESRAAAFVGHQLLVLGVNDGNLRQVDADGAARWSELNADGGWVAMDTAVVDGTLYLALVRNRPGSGEEGELLVYEFGDTQRYELVHATETKGGIDLVRVVRSPLTPQRELVVLTAGETDRALHRCSIAIPAADVRG